MKCSFCIRNIHDYLNRTLPPKQTFEMQQHLESCIKCSQRLREYSSVRELLSERHKLPSAASQRTFRRVLTSSRWSIIKELAFAFDWLRVYWRDLDSRFIWSKVYALPLTCLLFSLTLINLQVKEGKVAAVPEMNFFGVNGEEDILDHTAPPPSFRRVAVRQSQPGMNRLVRTARKSHYDDSLFVVAEITPEGNAEIGDVLEYPKNSRLIDAIGDTLQHSQFEQCSEMDETLVLVSFYKIDVWEGSRIDPYLQYRFPN